MPYSLLLARHGETDWNRRKLLQGRSDSPLTPRGLAQAYALASFARWFGIGRILSSPLSRAHRTAEIVASTAGADLDLHEALVEVDFGLCAGGTLDDAEARFPGLRAARERDRWKEPWPGGESYAQVLERVRPLAGHLLEAIRREPVLVVAHESIHRVLIHAAAETPIPEVLASSQPPEVVVVIGENGSLRHVRIPVPFRSAGLRWHPGLAPRAGAPLSLPSAAAAAPSP